jgi:ectoine hydroxylase-related dioxygenase (phytanoyl-CoA dioxygenase family)
MNIATSPARFATEENVAAYWRDGAVCLKGVLPQEWIATLREGAEATRHQPSPDTHWYHGGPGQSRVFFNVSYSWPRVEAFRRFIWDSGVTELAARFARAKKLNLLWDGVFYRTPGLDQPTPWHQDMPYWPVEGDQIVSVWMPLDAAPVDSVLSFYRGSHRMGRFKRLSFRDGGRSPHFAAGDRADARDVPDLEAGPEAKNVLRWDMEPGDCIVFHGYALHGSPGNKHSDRPLRATTFRFAGDDAIYAHRPEGMSPSFTGHALKPGDALDSELFPVVWRG